MSKEDKDAIVLAVFAASLRHECIIDDYQTIPLRQVTLANPEHLAKLKEGVEAAVMNFFGCSELRYFRVELWLDEALQRAGPKKLLFGSALRLIGALGRD
jgi:hypothetical protein